MGKLAELEEELAQLAFGTGYFLSNTLSHRLGLIEANVKPLYISKRQRYERLTFLAISTLYGIELFSDTLENVRNNLFFLFFGSYEGLFARKISRNFCKSIECILKENIIPVDIVNPETVYFHGWRFDQKNNRVEVKKRTHSIASLTSKENFA